MLAKLSPDFQNHRGLELEVNLRLKLHYRCQSKVSYILSSVLVLLVQQNTCIGRSITDEEIENYPLAIIIVADKGILSRKSYPALVTKKQTNKTPTNKQNKAKSQKTILQYTFL